jgi:pimeloyl-ACP methyl ester carboxylesterase
VVILPPGYAVSSAHFPTVYITHGFGGTLENSAAPFVTMVATQMASGKLPPMIWVLLEQVVPGGTHEFADSANNGPWGTALTRELIPDLENRYRMDGRSSGRLLNGHSSGGWATAWLQVTYPDLFGGTWSTSPDPLDFHEFTNVDLYSRANLYKDDVGAATRLLRPAQDENATLARFAQREAVLGEYGGQMASFEWVFSPRGPDGRPRELFDRATGIIDRAVASYWTEHFDLARRLAADASTLVPRLRGKLHFVVGTEDTFYLDRGVRRLQQVIDPLGYQGKFTYLAGRDHFNLYEGDLLASIAAQMYEIARPRANWRAPSSVPALAR